ncbi:uncharacterized protein LOC144129638 [Amblyomma americanum]
MLLSRETSFIERDEQHCAGPTYHVALCFSGGRSASRASTSTRGSLRNGVLRSGGDYVYALIRAAQCAVPQKMDHARRHVIATQEILTSFRAYVTSAVLLRHLAFSLLQTLAGTREEDKGWGDKHISCQ